MNTETKEKEREPEEARKDAPEKKRAADSAGRPSSRPRRSFQKNTRRSSRRERAKPEFDQKVLNVRRVTRVVKGGRRFSFSVALVIGNRKGSVGVGIGKASDTALAIEKAAKDAKKNLISVQLTSTKSIPHEVEEKYASARVKIFPAPGKGLSAGSAVRVILELAGINNVGAKVLSRSKNKLNVARASIKALKKLSAR